MPIAATIRDGRASRTRTRRRASALTDATVAVGVDVGGTKVLALALRGRLARTRRRVPPADARLGRRSARRDRADRARRGQRRRRRHRRARRRRARPRRLPRRDALRRQPARRLRPAAAGSRCTERLGVPVTIDNDANVAAWGERVAGAGENADHMLMVTLGTGVGGGLVLGGQLYRGAHGMAGEIGHFVVQLDGEPCQCGQKRLLGALRVGHRARPHRARGAASPAARKSSRKPATGDDAAIARAAHVHALDRDRPRRSGQHPRPEPDRDRRWA